MRLTRYREEIRTGNSSTEVHYLITNIPPENCTAQSLLELGRTHWDIESKVHHRKDEVFGEDRSTIRRGNGPRNMAALRNIAVSVMNASGITNVKRCVDNLKYNCTALLKAAFQVA